MISAEGGNATFILLNHTTINPMPSLSAHLALYASPGRGPCRAVELDVETARVLRVTCIKHHVGDGHAAQKQNVHTGRKKLGEVIHGSNVVENQMALGTSGRRARKCCHDR